ncbi:MAG: MFS transporter [Hamadaea sp.]|uniref:MFS transporter n=1 Tax=Hamadaea sp. TaxID=2024425 RepID=UPI0017F441BD|nr:MFS transporter [Hamadaea sp.]NUR69263.1 MFS transporter [Hamadaea sp.]NUT22033.1 MFS transporter [Hamadaea sp.]
MTVVESKAGSREWIGLAVLVLPCLIISMDVSILFLALPFISEGLQPTATQQLWIMDAYGFGLAGALITMGSLGDRIGRRKLLLIGAAAFGAVSVAAAYSGSAELLIASRAVLGIAAATLMPSTMALIRNMFHNEKERKSAIGIWTGSLTSGIMLGPIIAGLMLDHFWWGSVFMINLPAMALLLVLAPFLLPEFKSPENGRFDLLGAAISLFAIVAVIYGIKQLAVEGFEIVPLAAVVVGLAFGLLFIRRQLGHPAPLIDMRLFKNSPFTMSILTKVITGFGLTGIGLYANQYLQLVMGMRPFTAALWSLVTIPAVMVAMFLSVGLAAKVRPSRIIGTGLVVMTLGFGVLYLLAPDAELWQLLVGSGAVAAGMMMTAPLIADLVLTAAPPERAGAASALAETSDELGTALGVAILGTVGAAVYHHQMLDTAIPGAPAAAVDAAHSTLGGAFQVAAALPPEVAGPLLTAAREAFTHGMNFAALTGAGVSLVWGVLIFVILRRMPVGYITPGGAKENKDDEEKDLAAAPSA